MKTRSFTIPAALPANDNGSVLLCENGCRRPAASKDHLLCVECVEAEGARYFVGDDEGELLSRGIPTNERMD